MYNEFRGVIDGGRGEVVARERMCRFYG
jgi:hypothetical protein